MKPETEDLRRITRQTYDMLPMLMSTTRSLISKVNNKEDVAVVLSIKAAETLSKTDILFLLANALIKLTELEKDKQSV